MNEKGLRKLIESFPEYKKTLETPEVLQAFKNLVAKVDIILFSWRKAPRTKSRVLLNSSIRRSIMPMKKPSMLMKLKEEMKEIRRKEVKRKGLDPLRAEKKDQNLMSMTTLIVEEKEVVEVLKNTNHLKMRMKWISRKMIVLRYREVRLNLNNLNRLLQGPRERQLVA